MKVLRSLSNVKKRNLLFFIALIYLSTILIFGVIYWKIANISYGEFFVFQDDINKNIKINAFKKQMKINIYNKDFKNSISDLITSEEYKRPVVKNFDDKTNKIYTFAFDNPLGEVWANYYYLLLQGKEITHMRIESDKEETVNNKLVHRLKIDFYKINDENNNYKIYKNNNDKLKKVDTIDVWIENYPIVYEEFFNDNYYFYPLSFYFTNLIENSISYLDDSPIVLKNIVNDKFKYSLWNFMYFSTVTITTLGYGDILPNSMLVRVLVMFETVLGVFIIGTFGSCLFWNNKF